MIEKYMLLIASVSALIGAVGALRFPDFYTRVHALTMVTVGGTMLGLLGLVAERGLDAYFVKTLVIIAFIAITSPAGAHAIAQAAHASGVRPEPHGVPDALAEKKKHEPEHETQSKEQKQPLLLGAPKYLPAPNARKEIKGE